MSAVELGRGRCDIPASFDTVSKKGDFGVVVGLGVRILCSMVRLLMDTAWNLKRRQRLGAGVAGRLNGGG